MNATLLSVIRTIVVTGLILGHVSADRLFADGKAKLPRTPPIDAPVPFARRELPQGFARPTLQVNLSAPLDGVLSDILVEEGDTVEKGQLLAVIDNRIAAAAVAVAAAVANQDGEIESAQSALDLAENLVSRLAKLQDMQAGAEFEWVQAKARRDQAAAALATARENQLQAQGNLQLAQARLESHNIRAPFAGTIVNVASSPGTTLTPSDDLLTLVQLRSLDAQLNLPWHLLGRLDPGKTYRLIATNPINRTIPARLVFAAPIVNSPSQTFRCLFRIDNSDLSLPAGFAVRFDEAHPETLPEETR